MFGFAGPVVGALGDGLTPPSGVHYADSPGQYEDGVAVEAWLDAAGPDVAGGGFDREHYEAY